MVLLLKNLPKLRQVKEARNLVYELFADHDASPDVATNLDLLADEVWHVWTRHQEIIDLLLTELTGESTAPEMSSPSDQ